MANTPTGLEYATANHGRWLRKLLRPNGRRVHIAASPEEHEKLRKTLTRIEPDDEYDVFIHGSDEHVYFHVLLYLDVNTYRSLVSGSP